MLSAGRISRITQDMAGVKAVVMIITNFSFINLRKILFKS
jgi:hypothetical protein